jgi:hypothetical protein
MQILQEGIGWVTQTFDDGSVRVTRTTLNTEILHSYGVIAKPGFLFDLDRSNFYPIRQDAADISITSEPPVFKDEGVFDFVNQFI